MTAVRSPLTGRRLLAPGGRVVRVDGRVVAVTAGLVAAAAAGTAASVSVGDFPIPLRDVVPAILGSGSADSDFIVRTLRLPRALTGLLVGACFGVSGAVFQSLARNPLASPDVIGITAGAGAAAVAVIVLTGATGIAVAGGALGGALATATAVYLLAHRRGTSSYRLVLVGIGVAAALTAVTSYLLTQAEIFDAQRAFLWLTGSLNGRGWDHARTTAAAVVVLLPLVVVLGRPLRLLELGDDTARGLGVRVEAARASLVLVAVTLAAVATAAAGPVGFVALAAPQIARRLTGAGTTLVPPALVGALLVVLADLVGRRLLAPVELPVGVVSGIVGGPYLLWLLARANRIGTGA